MNVSGIIPRRYTMKRSLIIKVLATLFVLMESSIVFAQMVAGFHIVA